MQRYHKDLYFPHKQEVTFLCLRLNKLSWGYTNHSFERIKERGNIEAIGYCLRDCRLNEGQIFEYYIGYEGKIEKAVFRIEFDRTKDLIIVLNKDKVIITVYLNNKIDNHSTLDPKKYCLEPLTSIV